MTKPPQSPRETFAFRKFQVRFGLFIIVSNLLAAELPYILPKFWFLLGHVIQRGGPFLDEVGRGKQGKHRVKIAG